MANGGVISAEGLTPKLQAFADAYMSTAKFNGTEAACQAQDNDKTLQVCSRRPYELAPGFIPNEELEVG